MAATGHRAAKARGGGPNRPFFEQLRSAPVFLGILAGLLVVFAADMISYALACVRWSARAAGRQLRR